MIDEKYGFDTTGMTQEEIEEIDKEFKRDEFRLEFIESLHGNLDELETYIEEKKHIVKEKIEKYENEKDTSNAILFKAILDMLNSIKRTDLYPLMELDKEDLWSYELTFSTEGIDLEVTHFDIGDSWEDSLFACVPFTRALARAKVISVSEYAQKYGVEPVTVRQWIRRGKLRSARKRGSEWFIPELAVPNAETHYSTVDYHFKKKISGVPDELKYLNGHDSVHISQNKEDRKLFEVLFWDDEEDVPPITMTTKEREKLEYYLLGHPDVYATDTIIDL